MDPLSWLSDAEPRDLLPMLAAAMLALAVLAAWAEHRRTRRRDVDRPGWVPWNAIQVMAFLLAIVLAGLALAGRG